MIANSSHLETFQRRPKILLLYPYYWPHYKAGGPVQSLFNLVSYFRTKAEFFTISLSKDIDKQYPEKMPVLHEWTKGPNEENIYFTNHISVFLIFKLIRQIKPDVIFINGVFNTNTTLPGLLWGKILRIKVVISPRGMLQEWALKRNSIVKKLFLYGLNFFLRKNEIWHATDDLEKKDIIKIFGKTQRVNIASNIPRGLSSLTKLVFPGTGKIKLVYLSLINPNKNLHLIIDQVNLLSSFTLDIYGPVIDRDYWNFCKDKLTSGLISYKGPIPSWDVPGILNKYHFFILPTQGENFGHAIFDSLSSGVPVIISRKTPWLKVDSYGAGFYLDEPFSISLRKVLEKIMTLSPETYDQYRERSMAYAAHYLKENDYVKDYSFLIDG